jgi:hypothetical protein
MNNLINERISPIALYFMMQSYRKDDFADVLNDFGIGEFAKYYDEYKGKIYGVDELLEYFDGNYEKLAKDLMLFFAPFLPNDFVLTKDLEKLRQTLEPIYGAEITNAIIKAIEILSIITILPSREQEVMIKEVLNILLILSKIINLIEG